VVNLELRIALEVAKKGFEVIEKLWNKTKYFLQAMATLAQHSFIR
jgi:hypothetical protein